MIKKNVVLFLGAGFSKSISSSLPLGTDLLEKILAVVDDETRVSIKSLLPESFLAQRGTIPENVALIQPFELLLAMVQRLRSQQLNGRPSLADIDYNRLWRKIITGVAQVTRFQHPGFQYYEDIATEFGQFIKFLREVSHEVSVTIVTTNYDLIADKAAQYITDEYLGYSHNASPPKDLRRSQYGCPIRGVWTQLANGNYILDQEYEPWALTRGIPVYKLHGSTNWAYCDICKKLDLSATRYDVQAVFSSNEPLAKCQNCESPYTWLIIPPIPNKNSMSHPVLAQVWRAAEEVLEAAQLVIFVGYSFPLADPVVLEMVTTAQLRSRHAHGEPWRYLVFDQKDNVCQQY